MIPNCFFSIAGAKFELLAASKQSITLFTKIFAMMNHKTIE